MQKTIFHIGYHKTASSYLQHVIFPQLPVNLINPDEEHINLFSNGDLRDVEKFADWVQGVVSSMMDIQITTLISHEVLSGHPNGYRSKYMPLLIAENISKTFPDTKILMIIRNQFDYITSMYTFRVAKKGEEYRSFDKFIIEEGQLGLVEHLEYHVLVEYYQRLFGKGHVKVLPLELLVKYPDAFFSELGEFLQISLQGLDLGKPINVSTKNKMVLSFWRPVNFIVRHFVRFAIQVTGKPKQNFRGLTYRYFQLKNKITQPLSHIFRISGNIDIKKTSEYPKLKERFGVSNAILQDLIGYDLSSLGFPMNED